MKNLFILAILLLVYSFGSSAILFAQEPPCTINYQTCRTGCLPVETLSTNETSWTQTAAEELINNIVFQEYSLCSIGVGSPTCNAEYCSASAYESCFFDPSISCSYELKVYYTDEKEGKIELNPLGGPCLSGIGSWDVSCCYPSGMTSESWCGQTYDGESFNPDQCCSGICGQTGPEWYEIQCLDSASAIGPDACEWSSDWVVYNGYTDGSSICCNGTVVTGNNCDPDSDGISSETDNCPNNCNSNQVDADGDSIGDVCDETPGCGGCGEPACEQKC